MSEPAFEIRDSADGCELTILARPRARRTEFAGTHDGTLCIRLQALPVDGKANDELLRFLADALGVPRSAVMLKRGATSRRKTLLVKGLTAAGVARRLNAFDTGE